MPFEVACPKEVCRMIEVAPELTFASERSEGEFTDAELTILALAAVT